MGLCIHYSGRIKDAASLPQLIDEVREVSLVYGWKYQILESSFPNNTLAYQESLQLIYGICVTPPECETIDLAFLSNGIMVCPAYIPVFGTSEEAKRRNYIYHISVKTQFAGVKAHALIINLFKYLNNKYLFDFKMYDEGQYWETGDEYVLRETFRKYEALFDNFELSLQAFPIEEGEDLMDYFDRLLEHINRLKDKNLNN